MIYVSPIFAIIIYKRHFQDEKELDYQSFLGRSLLAEGAWNSEIW